jgi:uncharacterized surface protein with fasciclin (FAS1) repeats
MPNRPVSLAFAVLLLGALAACGDDDSGSSADDAAAATTAAEVVVDPTTAATTMGDAETTAAASGDIVDTAVGAGQFSTLVTAVQAAGLEETLRGAGPFTVFAPTDDAFSALPAGTLDTLLEDPSGALADVLTYHVVEGEVQSADVAGLDGQEVTTVNGAPFIVDVGDDGSVILTDAAGNQVAVVTTDVQASNGVIHVIDGVLLPA